LPWSYGSLWVWFLLFTRCTKYNISVISWQSVLWVEETGVTGKTHETASHWQTLLHNVSSTHHHEWHSD
jgi:hypothetical protein